MLVGLHLGVSGPAAWAHTGTVKMHMIDTTARLMNARVKVASSVMGREAVRLLLSEKISSSGH